MKPIEFCWWLSGFLDNTDPTRDHVLTPNDVKLIKERLAKFVEGGSTQAPKGLQ